MPKAITISDYKYRLFSGTNYNSMNEQLRKLTVDAHYYYRKGRYARIYRIPVAELDKLPQDGGEPYLPVDENSGFSLYDLSDVNRDLKRWGWDGISDPWTSVCEPDPEDDE